MTLALLVGGCTTAEEPEPSASPAAADDAASRSVEVAPGRAAALSLGEVRIEFPGNAVATEGTATLTAGGRPPPRALRESRAAAATDLIEVALDGTDLTGRVTVRRAVPDDWPGRWRPMMVWQDPAGGWQWLPTRLVTTEAGRVAVARTGHFSDGFLAAFDVQAAAERASKALGEFVTGRAGVANPQCDGEDAAREDLEVSSDSGDAVKWCLGFEDGVHVLKVANNRRTLAQVSLPLGSQVISGDEYGFSIDNLVRAVGTGVETFAQAFPDDRTILMVRAGRSVTVQVPADAEGGAEITGSGVGYLLSILVNAVEMYATVSVAAGLKPATNADVLWSFLGDGAGKGSDWAEAATSCLQQMTEIYTDDFTAPVTLVTELERAVQFAGTCGPEIGAASIEASGALGWLASATAASVASIVTLVYSLMEQLFVGVREVSDAVRYGFGSGDDPIYTIRTTPLVDTSLAGTDWRVHGGQLRIGIDGFAESSGHSSCPDFEVDLETVSDWCDAVMLFEAEPTADGMTLTVVDSYHVNRTTGEQYPSGGEYDVPVGSQFTATPDGEDYLYTQRFAPDGSEVFAGSANGLGNPWLCRLESSDPESLCGA